MGYYSAFTLMTFEKKMGLLSFSLLIVSEGFIYKS